MSMPVLIGFSFSALATSINTPTPLAPSLAPSIGVFHFVLSGSWSAKGRESQCAARSILFFASGLNDAMMFLPSHVFPLYRRALNSCTYTVSAFSLKKSTNHSAHRACASLPGTLGPKSNCFLT